MLDRQTENWADRAERESSGERGRADWPAWPGPSYNNNNPRLGRLSWVITTRILGRREQGAGRATVGVMSPQPVNLTQ